MSRSQRLISQPLIRENELRTGLPCPVPVDLDWPSYGSGRTRGAPWYLLAALALSRAGYRVLMHGSNEFTRGTTAEEGLDALGMRPAHRPKQALVGLGLPSALPVGVGVVGPAREREADQLVAHRLE